MDGGRMEDSSKWKAQRERENSFFFWIEEVEKRAKEEKNDEFETEKRWNAGFFSVIFFSLSPFARGDLVWSQGSRLNAPVVTTNPGGILSFVKLKRSR
ncbi:hypothetical protein AVEN_188894-1 [Araneus ventricosus]|uniref:Uncharacterized protein n=1 Tax=Araneus ventricosus TaxID=182803 RepID=A0A4Y2P5X9_ARAVE|nr:hypothetical protein AVEN_188894-1 [Araneus ventricosus]